MVFMGPSNLNHSVILQSSDVESKIRPVFTLYLTVQGKFASNSCCHS